MDGSWLKTFNAAIGPDNPKEHAALKALMQIKYCAGIGELIWAMTTCSPDIAFTSVKLSQSNSRLAEHRYHGLKHAIGYLYMTQRDGIYFWRTRPRLDLPEDPLPIINSNCSDLLLDNQPDHNASITLPAATLTGTLVSRRDVHLVVSAYSLQEVPLHTRQNSSPRSPSQPLRPNSWQPATLVTCHYSYAAFYDGTWMFLKKQPPLLTKTMTDAPRCKKHRNQSRRHITLILSILHCVNGSNPTSFTLNGSTHQLILLTISPSLSLECSFIGTPIFSQDMSLPRKLLLHTRTDLRRTLIDSYQNHSQPP
jgi:hypothetical protein